MEVDTSRCSLALETAQKLTAQGLFVIPVPFKSKKACLARWSSSRLLQSELPKHFGNKSNIGLLLGVGPRFITDVDLDSHEATAVARLISGPATCRISGRKGKQSSHYFFSLPHAIKTKKFVAPGRQMILEIRGAGHLTLLPPSIHPSGEKVEWEQAESFGTSTEAELLNWGAKVASAALLATCWPTVGSRHDGVLALSGMLARAGWTIDATIEFVLAAARVARDEEWRNREQDIRSTFTRIVKGEAATGTPRACKYFGEAQVGRVCKWLNLADSRSSFENSADFSPSTDSMNVSRFAKQHSSCLRFCTEQNKWYAWTGNHWRENETGEAVRRAVETARSIYGEAKNEENDARRAELAKWAIRSESRPRIDALVALARYHSDIEVRSYAETFDRDPWLLNCENGILDLRVGELRPHRSDEMITKIVPVSYDPEALCPRWDKFLDEVTCGNSPLALYLQRIVGYTLTGIIRERAFFLFFGEGNNGKTIFLRIIGRMLGDYAHCVPFQEFIQKKVDGGSNEIAQLQGARFVYSTEPPLDRAFNEALLKQLSGGDKVRARSLYHESVEWDMQGKLFFAANHKPAIRETTGAIWNRLQSIPWLASFQGDDDDKELFEKLVPELPGILAWAVKGCVSWQLVGLEPPLDVIAANLEYRAENDTLSDFIRDRCEESPSAHVLVGDFHTEYSEWAPKNGAGQMSKRAIGLELGRRGFRKSAYNGKDAWRGIGLRPKVVG
jgi:putative DNA primase/helicase